jgi:hypothetical protein
MKIKINYKYIKISFRNYIIQSNKSIQETFQVSAIIIFEFDENKNLILLKNQYAIIVYVF